MVIMCWIAGKVYNSAFVCFQLPVAFTCRLVYGESVNISMPVNLRTNEYFNKYTGTHSG